MNAQKNSQWLFRFFAAVAIFAMFFSQSAGVANAQGANPPSKVSKDTLAQPSLDETQTYFERIGVTKGAISVVLELAGKPAAVVFAENQGQAQLTSLTSAQISLIKQEQSSVMNAVQKTGIKYTELFRAQKSYNGIWLRIDMKDLKALASLPGVKAIHPVISKTLDNSASVPLIGAPQVWGGSGQYQGEGITIGIIDTGIDYIHTNFGGSGVDYASQDFTSLGELGNLFPTNKVVGGWDFVGDDYDANDASPIISPDPDPMDCGGHGSHVAGSAAGFGVNADGTTYVEDIANNYSTLKDLSSADYISQFRIGPGVAPKAELYSLRVFGCGGSTDVVVAAIDWAMDPNNDGDLSDHLDVINMSLGSPYGSVNDSDAVASDNAAKAGVIVVASAGNSGDVYYVTGSPAVAPNAISVASSVDAGNVINVFTVTAAPTMALGDYIAATTDFGAPIPFNVSGDLAYADVPTGCTAAGPITNVSGKIALIDRGTCSFAEKAKNAQLAGAIGVLIANNTAGMLFMTGSDPSITIPVMSTTQANGTTLKTNLTAGTVTITLKTDTVVTYDPTIVDTVSVFSSRGLSRGGSLLKPDISAPGDSIFSTSYGTGNEGENLSGTSMAAPHMTGVMALLREIHPDWSVAELKALAMNTAGKDLFTGPSLSGLKHTPTREGAGRVDIPAAATSNVVAYYKNDPGQVSVAFGSVAVVDNLLGIDKTIVKSITLSNLGNVDESYNVSFDSRYISKSNPGLTFILLNAGNLPISNPVTVPAYGSLDIKVQVSIDAAFLLRARDATISTANGRERFSEGGGYVAFASTGSSPSLRVPVEIAARPASNMQVDESEITLGTPANGTFSLTPSGTPVDTLDDGSLVLITELKDVSPNDSWSTFSDNSADLKYVGIATDFNANTFATSSAYFGIATWGNWDTLHTTEFDIYIDTDEDGVDDYVLYNGHTGTSASPTDTLVSVLINLHTGAGVISDYVNWFGGGSNTNTFNNNVLELDVAFGSLGLVEGGNTDFNFQVYSFTRESGLVDISNVMHYDVAHESFSSNYYFGTPFWDDNSFYAPTLDINYDKANILANESEGLLLLHMHNTTATTAEVVPLQLKDTVAKDTVGVFRPSNGNEFLKFKNTSGTPDISMHFGVAGDKPLAGDWNGDGTDSLGVYRNGKFYLRNANSTGSADLAFAFGLATDQPIVGDWDGDGVDTIGVYRSSTGKFYLRNSNSAGAPDLVFTIGVPGDVAIVGDWDGDGTDTIGLFRPSNNKFFLKNTNSAVGPMDVVFTYGIAGDKPVVGDWNNDDIDTIGLYRGNKFFLRNTNSSGIADIKAVFGNVGDIPVIGNWDGLP